MSDWSKATDEERLAYAEWRYKKGMNVNCAYDYRKYNIVDFIYTKDNTHPKDIWVNDGLLCLYDSGENKWAEIIEEVNVDFNPKSGHWLGEPTFKAGDEVEYQGSTISKVIHVFDGMAWIKNADQKYGSLVDLSNLRKPDPDKVYRGIAKGLMKTTYRCITDNGIRYIDSKDVEQMLIEAIKKCKEL